MLFTALWTKSVPKESIITFIPSQEVRSSCESITLVLLNFCVPSHLLILHITIPLLMPTFFVLLIMSIGNFLNSGIDQYLAFCNALNKEHIEVLDLYVYNLGIGSGQISFSVAVGVMKSVIALILFTFANTASKKIRGTSVF